MKVNKDTTVYCSFSSNPGNLGCEFHNRGFEELGINAVYKSFKVYDIRQALDAMRTLGIKGAGVSMPFKQHVLKYVDWLSPEAEEIGAANTILNVGPNDALHAHNTDWVAVDSLLSKFDEDVYILGNGGYSKAVQYTCRKQNKDCHIFTRDNWDDLHQLRDKLIFNCTPMDRDWVNPHESNRYIDCLADTNTGKILSAIQAKAQFKLYTGYEYPI